MGRDYGVTNSSRPDKDYRDGDQWKTKPIDGVEFIGRFLQHLLPQRMHHIRRYGWMGRRTKNEKLVWLREYFRGKDSQVQQQQPSESEEDPQQGSDEEPSRPCRYCQGALYLTGTTYRPKVSEILAMPLQWFLEARAGPIVTLGEKVKDRAKLPQGKNAETGREQAPWPISAHL
ncbi:MAG: transposase [Pirellulaceae bacterium]